MRNIGITIKKELRSIFRDKKTLVTLLVFPILIPVMIFLYAFMYDSADDIKRYVIGVDYQPNTTEISLLDESHLDIQKYSDKKEMEEAYRRGEIVGYIDYQEDSGKYYGYTNEDSEEGMYVRNYISTYLEGYNQYLTKLYLIGEDIDVEKAYDHIQYEIIDLEGENFILIMMFTISFTYIVMAIVLATTNMATSATAVEKENGTLETILTFPIRVRDLILGKYLSTVIMGILSSMIGLILTLSSLGIATKSFSVFQDIHFMVYGSSVFISILIVVLASFFIAGLSIAVTSFAKSYKEAQSMSSVLNILTIIPMFISILGMEIKKWYYFIPIFNYTQVLMDIFSGNFDWLAILIVLVSSIVYVILVITYILRRYKTEKVLF